jgi:hypothetical protein
MKKLLPHSWWSYLKTHGAADPNKYIGEPAALQSKNKVLDGKTYGTGNGADTNTRT